MAMGSVKMATMDTVNSMTADSQELASDGAMRVILIPMGDQTCGSRVRG